MAESNERVELNYDDARELQKRHGPNVVSIIKGVVRVRSFVMRPFRTFVYPMDRFDSAWIGTQAEQQKFLVQGLPTRVTL